MSRITQFATGGNRPIRVEQYTSGTATFTPSVPNSWCRVTLVSGGGGGARPTASSIGAGGGGGPSGATGVYWVRVSGPTTVVVGAGGLGATVSGAPGNPGSASQFGGLVVNGTNIGAGNFVNNFNSTPGGYLSATSVQELGLGFVGNLGGAGGAAGSNGSNGAANGGIGGITSGGGGGGGGGGGHFYGTAGNGGGGAGVAGGNATGFGAGGGGGSGNGGGNGGNGAGGLVIVEEFGN